MATNFTSIETSGTVTAATGVVATTGGITATAGGVTATAGNVAATVGNVVATAGVVKGCAGTGTASSNAVTISKQVGQITTESLTTAGLASQDITVTNTFVVAAGCVVASVMNGTNTQGTPAIGKITPAAGSVVIQLCNLHASQAFNGTFKISFIVMPT